VNTKEHASIREKRINTASSTAIVDTYARKNYLSNLLVGVVILVLVVLRVMNLLCRTKRIS